MATKDQLPFAGADGTTKAVSGGASGAHDFTEDPKDGAPKTGGGFMAEDRPQKMGTDDTVNKESVIKGDGPFPNVQFKDAGVQGTGSIGNSAKPFKGLKG